MLCREGNAVQQAIGRHCDRCFYIGTEILFYGDMGDFEEDLKEPAVSNRVAVIRDCLQKKDEAAKKGTTASPPREAQSSAQAVKTGGGVTARISKFAIGVPSSHVRQLVATQRLSREATRHIPKVSKSGQPVVPDDIDDDDVLFLFPDSECPFYKVSLETTMHVSSSQLHLAQRDNMFEGQGQEARTHHQGLLLSGSGWGDILKEKCLTELDTFVDDYKAWHLRNVEKRKVGKASPSKPGDGPQIIGRASSAINLGRDEEDQAAQEAAALHRDFGIG